MRSVGLVLLAFSVVIGGVAVWGLRSLSGAQAAPAPVSSLTGRTQVVVAAKPIGFGEPIDAAAVKLQPWPEGAAPAGAFRSVAELTAGGVNRIALAPIAANEPILPQRISGPGGRATLSGVIRPGMRASTIRVDDVMGVGGFVLPGDFVDVLVTRSEGEEQQVARSDVLLEGVRVLGVDQLADQSKDEPVVAKAATIEVTPAQAQKLALAGQVGTLSLALRSAEEPLARGAAGAQRTVRTADLTLASAPAPARTRPVRTVRRAAPQGPSIQVWRGTEQARVPVSRE